MSKVYTIFASWEMCGQVEIEADSVEEAIRMADEETKLSKFNECYVDGSFEINYDLVYDYYDE